MKRKILLLVPIAMFLLPTVAYAQQEEPISISNFLLDVLLLNIISTIVFGVLGIGLCIAGYYFFDRIAGLDLQRELVEDQNVAVAILLAGFFIGISLVIGAVMIS